MRFRSRDGEEKRITSTSGHVVIVGKEFVEVPDHMSSEAFATGCLSEKVWNEIKEDLKNDDTIATGNTGGGLIKADDDGVAGDGLVDPDKRTDAEIRFDMIKTVIVDTMMKGDRAKFFVQAGTPNRNELNTLCGFKVEAEEAEKVWNEIVEATNNGE